MLDKIAVTNIMAGIREYKDDWDDDGALKPTEVSLDLTTRVLEALCYTPAVNPYGDGSIDLWWSSTPTKILMNVGATGVVDISVHSPKDAPSND